MIYVFPSVETPIRQGDIFAKIPRTSVSLTELLTVSDQDVQVRSWKDIAVEGRPIEAVLPVTPVYAIVATQNCDALTAPEITLCEIQEFRMVERKAEHTEKPNKWQRMITQHARINQKWFYLPPDAKVGFAEKMAVDFRRTLRVRRADLEAYRDFRVGSLNALARQHFRERLGQFFRRYAYNEWYALNRQELEAYEKEHGGPVSPRYSWQADR
jgi:hypothetical protein